MPWTHRHWIETGVREVLANHMVGARPELRVAARTGGELATMASLFAGTCAAAVLLTG